jgi:hypothetical protein
MIRAWFALRKLRPTSFVTRVTAGVEARLDQKRARPDRASSDETGGPTTRSAANMPPMGGDALLNAVLFVSIGVYALAVCFQLGTAAVSFYSLIADTT